MSEDEAYDPWPDCIMDRTGCHSASHYERKYEVNERIAGFFGLDRDTYTLHELENVVIDYAESRKLVERCVIGYEEGLWKLFTLDAGQPLKFYQIAKHLVNFIMALPWSSPTSSNNSCVSSTSHM